MSNKKQYTIFFIAGFLAYFSTFFFGLVAGDDFARIYGHNDFIDRGLVSYIFNTMPERPFLLFTIYIDYLIAGNNFEYFRIVSVLLHVLTGVMFHQVLVKYANRKFKIYDWKIYFYTVLLFIVVPINTQTIIVVIQRGVILSTLLGLLSLIAFNNYFDKGKRFYLLLSILIFYFAVLSKPNAFVFLIFAVLYVVEVNQLSYKDAILKLKYHLLIYLYPLLMFLVFKRDIEVLDVYGPFEYFLYQVSNFFIYIKHTFYPFDLRFYHNYDVENVYFHSRSIIALLAHLGGIVFLIKKRHSEKIKPLILIFAAYISMIPESSFFPISHSFFEHRFYLASIFIFWSFVYLADKLKIKNIMSCGLIFFFILTSNLHAKKVSSPIKFNVNSLKYNPNDISLTASLITIAFELKDDQKVEAFAQIRKNIKFDKDFKYIEDLFLKSMIIKELNRQEKKKYFEDVIRFLNNHQINDRVSWKYVYSLLIDYVLLRNLKSVVSDKAYYLYLMEKSMRRFAPVFIQDPNYFKEIAKKHAAILVALLKIVEGVKVGIEPSLYGLVLGQLECYGYKYDAAIRSLTDKEERALNLFRKKCNVKNF